MTDLRPVPIPRHITRPQGCTCAGTTFHRDDCAIFDLPYDQRFAAVEVAHQRCERFTAELAKAVFGERLGLPNSRAGYLRSVNVAGSWSADLTVTDVDETARTWTAQVSDIWAINQTPPVLADQITITYHVPDLDTQGDPVPFPAITVGQTLRLSSRLA